MEAPTRLDRDLLKALARFEGGPVLNVYVDLDPTRFGTAAARESEINSLLNQAEDAVTEERFDHDTRERLKADIARARTLVDTPVRDARALALFACGDELYEVIPLLEAVEPLAVVTQRIVVEPLTAILPRDRWCIALVNSRVARVFVGTSLRLEEVIDIEDDVHGRHKQGGWSQARFERGIEKEIRDHLARSAERILRIYENDRFDAFAAGIVEEIVATFREVLHSYVEQRWAGRFDCDVENTNADEVLAAALPVMAEYEAAREKEALELLRQELGRGGRAVATAPEVSRALDERRVGTLLVEAGHERDAGLAIARALDQDADVLVMRHHTLDYADHLAALTRF
jgi:peptide chain release factor subunit 1